MSSSICISKGLRALFYFDMSSIPPFFLSIRACSILLIQIGIMKSDD